MLGLMQDYPLLTHTILEHGALNHGDREMVTRGVEGPIRRTTLAEVRNRALRVAKALEGEGVKLGVRVATMAWNRARSSSLTPSSSPLRSCSWLTVFRIAAAVSRSAASQRLRAKSRGRVTLPSRRSAKRRLPTTSSPG